jgi:hypothetical protein
MKLKPAPIPGLGSRANRALAHGLAVDRADRTASVSQFIAELGDAPEAPEQRRQRRRLWARTAAGAAATLLLVYGGWRLIQLPRPARGPDAASSATLIKPDPSLLPQMRGTPPGGAAISAQRAVALLQLLGIPVNGIDPSAALPEAKIRQLIETSPRHAILGSSPEQIQAALALCRQYGSGCQARWYADEGQRTVTLQPFELDATAVTVRDFRRFVDSTQYKTDAEIAGFGYAVVGESLQPVSGGSWRNAIKQHPVSDDSPVVGVTFRDAEAYCRARKQRLPTEDEWEYVARGPERHTFPWGDSVAPATRTSPDPPRASDGSPGGIGGRYRGLSGNVWQWVDTNSAGGTKILKGGSWLEPNPANRRAATQRMEQPTRADADSGFRCARSVPTWPDTELWLSRLK